MRRDPAFEDRIAWLRQVLDWKDAVADASEWLTAFKSSLFTDTIYVLTPHLDAVCLNYFDSRAFLHSFSVSV